MFLINLIIIFVLIALSGLLSSIETSIAATDKDKILKSSLDIDKKLEHQINTLLPKKEKIITSTLIIFSILNAAATTMMASCLIDVFWQR